MTARSSTFSRELLATAAAVVVAALAATPASADPPPAGAGTTENAQEALDRVGLGSLPDLGGRASRQRPAPGSTSGNFLLRKGAFTPLPDMPGTQQTVHIRVNNRGQTVGIAGVEGDVGAAPTQYGFMQRDGVFRRVDVRGASFTLPTGINDRGWVVGAYVDAAGALHSFVRNRDGDVNPIDVPSAAVTAVYDINDRGDVAGAYVDSDDVQHGFLWRRGKVTTIDPPGVQGAPGGPGTRVIGLNDRGDVVGSYFDGRVFHAFVRNRRGYTDIDPVEPLPGLGAEANGINNRGQVVGRYTVPIDDATAKLRGFKWKQGSVVTIPDAPGDRCDTVASDVNERRQIVVPAPGSMKPGCPIPLDPAG